MKKSPRTPALSIVMPAGNVESHIREAIDSILIQSFTDYECLIVNDRSTDATSQIVRSYADQRIIWLENKRGSALPLNLGLKAARAEYIAHMHPTDVMHPDRLKIQYAVMNTEPTLALCGSWMTRIGPKGEPGSIAGSLSGLIENPLPLFLRGNFLFHPTTMIRKSFLTRHRLKYENYPQAEDFKLWVEIARRGGKIYIESQPLHVHRESAKLIPPPKKEKPQQNNERVINETLKYLIAQNKTTHPELRAALAALRKLQKKELMAAPDVAQFFQNLFTKNESKLNLTGTPD